MQTPQFWWGQAQLLPLWNELGPRSQGSDWVTAMSQAQGSRCSMSKLKRSAPDGLGNSQLGKRSQQLHAPLLDAMHVWHLVQHHVLTVFQFIQRVVTTAYVTAVRIRGSPKELSTSMLPPAMFDVLAKLLLQRCNH